VFGDSFSDNGNGCALYYDLFSFACTPPYDVPRISNGLMWPDYLAKAVGSTITAVVDGGSNYAIAGSTISPENYYTFDPYATGFAQVDRFLAAHGSADPNAIYVVWLGVNDIDPPAAFTKEQFDQLVVMVGRLHAAGARNFLIPNLPDLGKFPGVIFFFDPVYVQQLSDMTIVFNQLLMGLPAKFPKANIRIADVYRLRTMIDRYPKVFGFTNTTESCYLVFSDGSVCPNPDKYWFWDGSHATTRGHQLLASLFVVELLKAGQLKGSDLVWRQ
jgi:phospholipase/lecithinase/hemolysin